MEQRLEPNNFEADSHNFGQSVERYGMASGIWYRKPRPVFWEKLFFGQKSPMLPLFDFQGENASALLSKYIFNLDVGDVTTWTGFSREVQSDEGPVTEEHFYAIGVLLAYCFSFGIRDLHKFNLVKTKTHLQVVDAEVVLTDLILPHETVLLPFRDVPFSLCGASLLADSLESISEAAKTRIMAGYFDLFGRLYDQYKKIRFVLNVNMDRRVPIRVILRNTGVYRDHLARRVSDATLMPEEKTQLSHADIPYFFKTLEDTRLQWVSGLNNKSEHVSNYSDFEPDVNRHGVEPGALLESHDQIEKKMVQGAMLLHKILDIRQTTDFAWNGSRLMLSSNGCENHFTGRTFLRKVGSAR
jgi:hypothetical protein